MDIIQCDLKELVLKCSCWAYVLNHHQCIAEKMTLSKNCNISQLLVPWLTFTFTACMVNCESLAIVPHCLGAAIKHTQRQRHATARIAEKKEEENFFFFFLIPSGVCLLCNPNWSAETRARTYRGSLWLFNPNRSVDSPLSHLTGVRAKTQTASNEGCYQSEENTTEATGDRYVLPLASLSRKNTHGLLSSFYRVCSRRMGWAVLLLQR